MHSTNIQTLHPEAAIALKQLSLLQCTMKQYMKQYNNYILFLQATYPAQLLQEFMAVVNEHRRARKTTSNEIGITRQVQWDYLVIAETVRISRQVESTPSWLQRLCRRWGDDTPQESEACRDPGNSTGAQEISNGVLATTSFKATNVLKFSQSPQLEATSTRPPLFLQSINVVAFQQLLRLQQLWQNIMANTLSSPPRLYSSLFHVLPAVSSLRPLSQSHLDAFLFRGITLRPSISSDNVSHPCPSLACLIYHRLDILLALQPPWRPL